MAIFRQGLSANCKIMKAYRSDIMGEINSLLKKAFYLNILWTKCFFNKNQHLSGTEPYRKTFILSIKNCVYFLLTSTLLIILCLNTSPLSAK